MKSKQKVTNGGKILKLSLLDDLKIVKTERRATYGPSLIFNEG